MPDLSHYVYGGLSAMTAEVVTPPIKTDKTRLQLQGKDTVQRYQGMGNCIATIVRKEGTAALYRDITTTLVHQEYFRYILLVFLYPGRTRSLRKKFQIIHT